MPYGGLSLFKGVEACDGLDFFEEVVENKRYLEYEKDESRIRE